MDRGIDKPTIAVASPTLRRETLNLVYAGLEVEEQRRQVEQSLTALEADPQLAEGLWAAHCEGQVVGAIMAQLHPGRTALVWPPRVTDLTAEGLSRHLLEACEQWLVEKGVELAQAMTPQVEKSERQLLVRCGFQYLADLLYLVSLAEEFPSSPPPTALEFEPYSPSQHDRLVQVVEATYQQTLDCPKLDGLRDIEDVIAGYRETGVFDPSRWLIVRHRRNDVGCLLLTDHPEYDNWELVYMGVVAAARGHGWGAKIAQYAQWLTRRAGRSRLVLAVDAGNHPAIQMYVSVGFRAWDRRSVFIKSLTEAQGAGG